MDVRKLSCLVAFVLLICTLRGESYGNKKRNLEELLDDRGDSVSWEIDENTAELLWDNCGMDLIHMRRAIEGLEHCVPGEISCSTNDIIPERPYAKESMQEVMTVLHPPMKQTLLDCLVRKNVMLRVSGEEGHSSNFYTKFLESIFPRSDVPRRSLQSTSGSPVPSPEPSPEPAPLAPDAGPAKSPTSSFFPPNVDSSSPPANESPSKQASGSDVQSNEQNNTRRTIAIAVGVTASVTFLVAALLFLCYRKVKSRSGVHRNDERPFVRLSKTKSDFSIGSSHNFYASGRPVNQEKLSTGSFSTVSNYNSKTSSMDDNVHVESHFLSASINQSPSTGPIGAAVAAATTKYSSAESTNIPNTPLKPPPGRSDNLPPAPPRLGKEGNFPPAPPPLGRKGNPPPAPPPLGRKGNPPPAPPPLGREGNPPPAPPPQGRTGNPPPAPPPPGRVGNPPPAPPPPANARPPPPPPPVPSTSLRPVSAGPPPPGPPPLLPLGGKSGPPPPPGPPPPRGGPPPPRGGPAPPRPPPRGGPAPPPPFGTKNSTTAGHGDSSEDEADAPKAKLKPFFWDKVLANPDSSMVWHQIKSGSFQFNEEMIETLFGYAQPDKPKNEKKSESSSKEPATQYIQIIDSKKSQNLSILLRALNVTTEEVCDALKEGNELPPEFVQTLLKMAPTAEEELKLRLFSGELSQLGPADRFLKALVDIPFSFKRMESLLFMCSLQEEVSLTKESFLTLEVACKELRNSRLFLKLLEAVLKTGNRMNDGTFRGGAQAFKLDTLLKLSDVKGIDGKTTLLHFVVQEIIRSEGVRAARAARENRSLSNVKSDDDLEGSVHESDEHYRDRGLQAVSGLSSELENVKKAAAVDADSLTGTVAKLSQGLNRTRKFLNNEMKNIGEESGFHQTLKSFVQNAEIDIMWLLEEEKRIMALVKSTGDYFHGNAGKDEGLRLFVIVRDFLIMLDKVCKEVSNLPKRPSRTPRKEASAASTSNDAPDSPSPSPDMRQRLFPAITDRRMDSSSDDET